jgi:phosphohistidine swiveling domain-containing protein
MSGRGEGGKGIGKAIVSSEAMSARKRKATSQVPEADVSIVDQSNRNVMGDRN